MLVRSFGKAYRVNTESEPLSELTSQSGKRRIGERLGRPVGRTRGPEKLIEVDVLLDPALPAAHGNFHGLYGLERQGSVECIGLALLLRIILRADRRECGKRSERP